MRINANSVRFVGMGYDIACDSLIIDQVDDLLNVIVLDSTGYILEVVTRASKFTAFVEGVAVEVTTNFDRDGIH